MAFDEVKEKFFWEFFWPPILTAARVLVYSLKEVGVFLSQPLLCCLDTG